ncbi:hypothetical protein MX633_11280 [Carnobacterium divergens]|uniref:hypothetical protein n=1 Tax=Carnobacterium divergens TaxID=2748 RepID=UPI0028908A73|nr:hypothetical protein [Carnobacterium divergens]MDT1997248.1 hypothetical protein [Carnobacterium divergens]
MRIIDKQKTKQNVKAVLKEYRSLARQNNTDARIKVKAVDDALERLPMSSQNILKLAYIDKCKRTTLEISLHLYCGVSTVERHKSKAFTEFSEAYHLTNLIEYIYEDE